MCGIWASVGPVPPRDVITAVAHRGPDGEGWEEYRTAAGPLILAHRRLAIVDTSPLGAQPMGRGPLHVVYNGEIYNHVELRTELEGLGHAFRTRSDTEVLLAAWQQWGADCLRRCNGMFAFVLWDQSAARLFAVRDRFGIKPLYWRHHGQELAFASEPKQFQALPQYHPRLNARAARRFLLVGQFDHDADTLFDGIRQVAAGEILEIPLSGQGADLAPVSRQWYQLPSAGLLDLTAGEATDRFRHLLDDAVRIRLRADVAVGSCLSGGLDSSSIVCLAGRRQHLTTVTAGYGDDPVDETKFAQEVSTAAGTRAIRISPDPNRLPEVLDAIIWHQDSPITGTTVFAQWCVFEAARAAGLPVMLDGQGADEQLAGYHPAFAAYHAGLATSLRLHRLRSELQARQRRHGIGVGRQIAEAVNALARPLVHRLRRLDRPDWLKPTGHENALLPATPDLARFLISQFRTTSLPMLLHWEDRSSMAHGVEARLPFLDYRLVDLTMGLGEAHKISDGETKWLLRRAMADLLPPLVRDRQDKIGFATPERRWLASAPVRDLLAAGLTESGTRFPGLFRRDGLMRLRDRLITGGISDPAAVWRIASFGHWGRLFGISA